MSSIINKGIAPAAATSGVTSSNPAYAWIEVNKPVTQVRFAWSDGTPIETVAGPLPAGTISGPAHMIPSGYRPTPALLVNPGYIVVGVEFEDGTKEFDVITDIKYRG